MHVAELWRYPVKSMAGERIAEIQIGKDGLRGDRRVAVFDRLGRRPDHPLSARDHPGLLNFRARSVPDGPTVEGPGMPATKWDEERVRQAVSEHCRRELELAEVPQGAFDDSPLLVIALSSLRELGDELGRQVDRRRFRANIYLDGTELEPGSEPTWTRRQIDIEGTVLVALDGCPRCSVTTRDPDSLETWPQLLRHLVLTRAEMMGVYCGVERPGRLAEGAQMQLQ